MIDNLAQRTETNTREYKKFVVGPESNRATIADIATACNGAITGDAVFRGDGRWVMFAHPSFLDQESFQDNSNGTSQIDPYFNHKRITDYTEGDKTLEGTQWYIFPQKENLATGIRELDIIVPNIPGNTNLEQFSRLTKDPVTLEKYADGVENYFESKFYTATGTKEKSYFQKLIDLNKSRSLIFNLSKLVSTEQRNWLVFTHNEVRKNNSFPNWIRNTNFGDLIIQHGNDFSIPIAGPIEFKAKFGDNRWSDAPFLYVQDVNKKTKIGFITDTLSVSLAREKLQSIQERFTSVLNRCPDGRRPKELYAFYSKHFPRNRNGASHGDLFVFQDGNNSEGEIKTAEHEIVHSVLMTSENSFSKSSWIEEGMAMYLGTSKGDPENLELSEYHKKRLINNIDNIDNFPIDDSTFEYYGGQLLIAFLEEQYGRDFLFDVYHISCGINRNPNQASDKVALKEIIESALPMSFEDFTQNFKDYVLNKLSPETVT